MRYYPIFLNTRDLKCLVVGAGNVAYRKIMGLLDTDADITIIAPEAVDEIKALSDRGRIRWIRRHYQPPEAADYDIVFSSVDDREINQTIFNNCRKAGVPVNVVDKPSLCSFIVPSRFSRGLIEIAVSSSGRAPFFTKYIRRRLEDIAPDYWEPLSEVAARFRAQVIEKFRDDPQRKTECFDRFLGLDWEKIIPQGADAIDRSVRGILEDE